MHIFGASAGTQTQWLPCARQCWRQCVRYVIVCERVRVTVYVWVRICTCAWEYENWMCVCDSEYECLSEKLRILTVAPCNSWNNFNPLTPNDHYIGCTAPLTSKCCILYIYSTNICTEYFKHGIYYTFFSLQNEVCFIILSYLVTVLFTFYIQGVPKLKKLIPAPKG